MSQLISNSKSVGKKAVLLEIMDEPVVGDLFTYSYKSYAKSEFIPTHLISLIVQHHFPSSELVHSFDPTHIIYKIQIKDLLGDNIKNWEYNRPPDLARCPEIASYIYNSKKQIDTMLYLAFTNTRNIFEVLDGIHRLTALRFIKSENSRPLDLLCPGDYGSNNDATWLYNQYLIVSIRFNANFGERVDAFKNLNKSQAVPDLYIRDHVKERRQIIDAIANEWYVKYKTHFSSSMDPNIGNTNRNKFVDLLDKLYNKYDIDDTCPNKLRQLLEDANARIIGKIPPKVSIKTRVKCKETGCYLFIYKNDKLEEFI